MCFYPVTTSQGRAGGLRWAWLAEAVGGSPRGGDRIFSDLLDERPTFVMADVMGNGLAAATAADALAVFLANTPPDRADPAAALAVLHTRLCQHWARTDWSRPGAGDFWFVDAVAVQFDLVAGTVEAAAGGAPYVWSFAPGGWARWDVPAGASLGIPDPDAGYAAGVASLPPGGMLFAATDGVPDATTAGGQFGRSGVQTALSGRTPAEVVGAVFAAARSAAGLSWPSSDATGICFAW